jgi:hypothetical protein
MKIVPVTPSGFCQKDLGAIGAGEKSAIFFKFKIVLIVRFSLSESDECYLFVFGSLVLWYFSIIVNWYYGILVRNVDKSNHFIQTTFLIAVSEGHNKFTEKFR